MAMRSEISGNVLTSPTLKKIKVRGEDRTICELRIMCAAYKQDAEGGYVQDDARTFPIQATVWNEHTAKRVYDLVRVGASILITGDTYVRPWINEEKNHAEAGVCMDVERVSLGLQRVESVEYRAKSRPDSQRRHERDGVATQQ